MYKSTVLSKLGKVNIFSFILLILFFSSKAQAANKDVLGDFPLEITGELGYNSKYIWRGFLLDDDSVVQPGLSLGFHGFTVGFWGSFDIDSDDVLNSDEVDYVVGYTHDFGRLSLSVGHTYYDFPASDSASREFYVGAALNTFLSPALTWYHDYGDEDSGGGDGNYILLELGHSLALGETPLTLDLSGHLGYNNNLFIKGEGEDLGLEVGLTIPLRENCLLQPHINYSIPFGDLEDSEDGNQKSHFYAGAKISFNF